MSPDYGLAQSFVAALTGSVLMPIRLRFVDDNKERKASGGECDGLLSELWPRVVDAQADGYGVFYFLNEIKGGPGSGYLGAAKDVDVTGVRVLAIDCDEGMPETWELHSPPWLVIQTSPGRGQVLWRAPPNSAVVEFKRMQRRLVAYYGSDHATVNPSRVFRLPGTLHLKREPHLVTFEEHPYDPLTDALDGLPELPPELPASAAVGDPVGLDHLKTILAHVDPDVSYPDWRDRLAAIRATNAGSEEDRYSLARDWSRTDELDPHGQFDHTWDTMPPKVGGVGYGTLYHLAIAGGYKGPSAAAAPSVPLAERFPAFNPWRPVSGTLRETVPGLEEIVPGLIEKGITTFLSATGGTHKSRLGVQWGLSIDAGIPIWGRRTLKCTFVYLSYEDHPHEVTRRMQTIARKLHLDPAAITAKWRDFTTEPSPLATIGDDIHLEPFYEEFKRYLLGIPGHKFVVLDSTYDVLVFTGQAKVNESAVQAALSLLDRFCQETDCTILCLWHPSQAGQDRGDASGWSVAWHNKPRARLAIEKVKDIDAYELSVKKRNNAPLPLKPVTLHWMDGILNPLSETAEEDQQSRFTEALLDAAIAMAVQGTPAATRGKLPKWALNEIEMKSSRRPTDREIKEELASLQRAGKLRYVKGERNVATGYYPPLGEQDATNKS